MRQYKKALQNQTQQEAVTKAAAKSRDRIYYMSCAGLFAALICVMTAYLLHIPVGVTGAYIHFGDALIYLAATLLPLPYACAAAAIGGSLADLLTAPMWAPATFLIKPLLVVLFTSKKEKIVTPRNVIAAIAAYGITVVGYYVAERILLGSAASAFLLSASGNVIQSTGSAVIFLIFGLMLDRMGIKKRLHIGE